MFYTGLIQFALKCDLCRAVGIKKKAAHCLRVTCASRLFQRGVDEKLIRDRIGHVSNALFKYEKASADQAKHVSNILSADQSSNGNLKEEIKNEGPMNDKAEEERLEKNFSIFEYVKFSDCEVNVFLQMVLNKNMKESESNITCE
jgi:hypothetical protein